MASGFIHAKPEDLSLQGGDGRQLQKAQHEYSNFLKKLEGCPYGESSVSAMEFPRAYCASR
ncbi:hypothetical protein PCAR4_290044 [Paraburkholderia caribensis]|nr:hypothetical protein PCAR4_290044 [Paraburkholderia caribensis]